MSLHFWSADWKGEIAGLFTNSYGTNSIRFLDFARCFIPLSHTLRNLKLDFCSPRSSMLLSVHALPKYQNVEPVWLWLKCQATSTDLLLGSKKLCLMLRNSIYPILDCARPADSICSRSAWLELAQIWFSPQKQVLCSNSMFHACFLWNFWDASKSSVRPAKHFPQLRQFGQFDEAQSWFVNVRCWFRPPAAAETGQEYMIKKQSYNFAKVIKHIQSQRSANGRVLHHVTHSCFVTGNEARLWGRKPSRFERFTAPQLQTMYKLCKHVMWDLTWSYCSYCTSSVHPMYIFF